MLDEGLLNLEMAHGVEKNDPLFEGRTTPRPPGQGGHGAVRPWVGQGQLVVVDVEPDEAPLGAAPLGAVPLGAVLLGAWPPAGPAPNPEIVVITLKLESSSTVTSVPSDLAMWTS